MTLDSFSELVLAMVCAWIIWRSLKAPQSFAGIGLAAALIGFAALLGLVKFSSFSEASEVVSGPHRFASLVAAVGAFPILAYSLAQPASPIAMRLAGAWRMTFVLAGFSVAIVALGFKLWGQIVPAVCALWIGYTVLFTTKKRSLLLVLGWLSLLASFAVTLLIKPDAIVVGVLSKPQLLHYFLALALILLTYKKQLQH